MKKHFFTFFNSQSLKVLAAIALLLAGGLYFKSVFKIPVAHATIPNVQVTLTAPVNTDPDTNPNSSSDPQWLGPAGSAPFQAYPYAPIINYSWQVFNGGPVVSVEIFTDGVDIGPMPTDNPSYYQSYIPGSAAGAHTTYVQVKQGDGSTWRSNTITFYTIKPPAQAVVTSNYSGANWTFAGSSGINPSDPCTLAACYGVGPQRYNLFANSATIKVAGLTALYKLPPTISSQVYSLGKKNNFFAKLINIAEASTCGSDTCTGVNDGGAIGFSVNYSDPSPASNPTYYCTINVVGTWNGQYSKATGAPFTISGPQSISGADTNGYESYQALTDPSAGANYTFSSPSTQATVNGYPSTSTTVSQSGACTSGGTLTFTLNSQSNPIIDVH